MTPHAEKLTMYGMAWDMKMIAVPPGTVVEVAGSPVKIDDGTCVCHAGVMYMTEKVYKKVRTRLDEMAQQNRRRAN